MPRRSREATKAGCSQNTHFAHAQSMPKRELRLGKPSEGCRAAVAKRQRRAALKTHISLTRSQCRSVSFGSASPAKDAAPQSRSDKGGLLSKHTFRSRAVNAEA